jgi:hypothetical protein
MTYSFTSTDSVTFTVTHAKHLAAKVAADLKRIQRFYGSPTDIAIAQYEEELIELLKNGYLGVVTYGFKKDGNWINPSLRYTAQDLSSSALDDDPGKVLPGANISNASFSSYLEYSASWDSLSSAEQQAFYNTVPLQRTGAPKPGVTGYFSSDLSYSAGGRALNRSIIKN